MMFVSRSAYRPARTVVVAVAVAVGHDGNPDTAIAADYRLMPMAVVVVAPATVDNRYRLSVDSIAVPRPVAIDRTTVDRVVPAATIDVPHGPFPRASYPVPPASLAMCNVRNPDRHIYPDLAPLVPNVQRYVMRLCLAD